MTDEEKLIVDYRASDKRGKKSIRDHASDTAMQFPDQRTPLLRLVPGSITKIADSAPLQKSVSLSLPALV